MRLKLCCGCNQLSVNWTSGAERKRQMPKIRFTFGQPFGQEHVNGRTAGRPAEGSRSEMVAISVRIFRRLRNKSIGLAMAKIGTGEDVFWRAERGGGFFLFFIYCFLLIFPFG